MEAKGASASVIRNAYRTALKPILDTAVEQNLIRTNPLSTGERTKLPRSEKDEALFLTAEQVELLANEITPPFGTLIRFAAYTGLRAGEHCALRVKTSTSCGRSSTSPSPSPSNRRSPTVRPKTYAQRKVNLPSFLVQPLAELIAPYANDPEAFVFRSTNRPTLVYGTFYTTTFKPAVPRALPPALHALPLPRPPAHGGRSDGQPLWSRRLLVMRRMGHSSITVTYDRYAKLFPERDAEIVAGLEAGRTRALTAFGAPEGRQPASGQGGLEATPALEAMPVSCSSSGG